MKKYYVKRIKKRLKENIESGQLPIDQQWALIEKAIDDLLQVDEINEEAVEKHDNEIENISKQILELQNKIGVVYKNTYDKILEL